MTGTDTVDFNSVGWRKAEFEVFIADANWREAETYKLFCPHEYTVRSWDTANGKQTRTFDRVVEFIREAGFTAMYGRMSANRYYLVGDYYYWTMPDPDGMGAEVLNRARITDYLFSEDLLGDLHCRYRKRNEPVQPLDEVVFLVRTHGQKENENE